MAFYKKNENFSSDGHFHYNYGFCFEDLAGSSVENFALAIIKKPGKNAFSTFLPGAMLHKTSKIMRAPATRCFFTCQQISQVLRRLSSGYAKA